MRDIRFKASIPCPICKSREDGCYDCAGKGYVKGTVTLEEIADAILERLDARDQ